MPIEIQRHVIGPLENNTYVARQNGENQGIVIDPAIGSEGVVENCINANLSIEAIVLTHGHADHILGIPAIINQFPGIPVYVHPADRPFLSDPALNGSSMIIGQPFTHAGEVRDLTPGTQAIAGMDFTVVHVPGHTPGGCAILADGQCLVGDTLFAGSIGRSDLAGGDGAQLINSIRDHILTLPADTVLWPGHGPDSTVGQEAANNPFLNGL